MAQIDQVATKKTGSTGSYLGDVEQTIQTYPCFRSSLLPGIVSGAGFGFIRGMSTKSVRIAGNWTVGTFVIVSTAGWHICKTRMNAERERVVSMVEEANQRKILPLPKASQSAEA